MSAFEALFVCRVQIHDHNPFVANELVEELILCTDRMRQLYWKEKQLPAAIEIAKRGVAEGETGVHKWLEDEQEILGHVKRLCYDIASFTWPGWNEPGISPTKEECSLGLDAARKNLDYAIRLSKGDLPVSRAHWMIGAHLLTQGEYTKAFDEFKSSEIYAIAAGADPEVKLCIGFAMLALHLRDGDLVDENLQAHLTLMDCQADTAPFADQIRTAATVLGISLP